MGLKCQECGVDIQSGGVPDFCDDCHSGFLKTWKLLDSEIYNLEW